MQCPECGADHHAAEHVDQAEAAAEIADAIETSAELDAAAQEQHEDAATERNADDNDTRERVAELEAAAAVQIAESEADAAVQIAESEADAVIGIAEAMADAESTDGAGDDEEIPEGDAIAEEPLPAAGDVQGAATAVTVPPQLDDAPEPGNGKPAAGARTQSKFRARRQHRR